MQSHLHPSSDSSASSRRWFDDQAWERTRFRWSILIAAICYPLWQLGYSWILHGKLDDPIWQRLMISTVCCMFVGLTFASKRVSRNQLAFLFVSTVCLISAHVLYLVAANDLNMLYVLGAYCVMFASGAILLTPVSLLIYFSFCMTATCALWITRHDANSLFLFLGAITSLAVTFASSQSILAVLRALRRSSEQLSSQAQAIEAGKKELETVMNSLGQGFFSFGPDGRCNDVYSQACLSLLEGSPAGHQFWDVLKMEKKDAATFKNWLRLFFSSPRDARARLMEFAPKTFPHTQGLSIVLDYYEVENANETLAQLVVVATDRSNEFKAQKEAQREQHRLKMIATLVSQRAIFQPFIAEIRQKLTLFAVTDGATAGAMKIEFIRFLHTIKGGFGLFAMDEFAHQIHSMESDWNPAFQKEAGADAILGLIQAHCRLIETQLEVFTNQHRSLLGRTIVDSERTIELSLTQLLGLAARAQAPAVQPLLWKELAQIALRPIGDYFQPYEKIAKQLARKQGKTLGEINFANSELLVYPECYTELFSTFVHAFRNAVDHGLERSEDRERAGKKIECAITVRFEHVVLEAQPCLRITVQDDGRGIDPEALRDQLIKKGRLSPTFSGSEADVLAKLFENGISSRDTVTEISGRGVGLDAIKSCAEKLRGRAVISSVFKQGTTLMVEVPYLLPINDNERGDLLKAV